MFCKQTAYHINKKISELALLLGIKFPIPKCIFFYVVTMSRKFELQLIAFQPGVPNTMYLHSPVRRVVPLPTLCLYLVFRFLGKKIMNLGPTFYFAQNPKSKSSPLYLRYSIIQLFRVKLSV